MVFVVFIMSTLNRFTIFITPSGTYINYGLINLKIIASHFFYRHNIIQRHISIAAIFKGEFEGCVMKTR